jgi:hypothetical protein
MFISNLVATKSKADVIAFLKSEECFSAVKGRIIIEGLPYTDAFPFATSAEQNYRKIATAVLVAKYEEKKDVKNGLWMDMYRLAVELCDKFDNSSDPVDVTPYIEAYEAWAKDDLDKHVMLWKETVQLAIREERLRDVVARITKKLKRIVNINVAAYLRSINEDPADHPWLMNA